MQPVFILPEGYERIYGRNALKNNIAAAIAVAETVRTTLGPKGMDKMLVDTLGDITVTNDGVTILEEMEIEHPAAKMIVDVAKTQEEEIGDGTTTAVIIAGELLKKAEELLEQNIHPSTIIRGFRIAQEKAIEVLNKIALNISYKDEEKLKEIAITAMTGKGAEVAKDHLSELVVKAVKLIYEGENTNPDNIKITKKEGKSVYDSKLVEGIIIDKEKVHANMPNKIKNAKIALINAPIEIRDTEIDAKIEITDPEKIQQFLDTEEKLLKKMVDKIINVGANVIFCQKGIDEIAQHFLSKAGILAVRRVKKSDMEKIAKATNARIVNTIQELTENDLGFAGEVYEEKVGDEKMIFIEKCKNPKSVTILIRGSTEHVINEIERAVKDAIGDVISAIKMGKIVGGAGACEVKLSLEIKKFASKLKGKEQLAVESFASALEVIPKTLAENSGLDPIDVLTELKSLNENNKKWFGINVFTGKPMDVINEGIIEPLKIKIQAINSASEVASMILRVDDVISAIGSKKKEGQEEFKNE